MDRGDVGYRVLYSFGDRGKADDGQGPLANLIAVRGAFYGTTAYGGAVNRRCPLGCGTVFRVDSSGRERVVYRFKGGKDGAFPSAGLIYKDALFGTTASGGGSRRCAGGCGTVFRVNADGTSEKVLHSFVGGSDGAEPVAALTSVGSTLYGTTQYGGGTTRLCPNGCGTIFRVSASGAELVLHRFKGGADGAYPLGGLYPFDGKLYGTTQYGGVRTNFCQTGCGTVFKIGTGGVKASLYSFRYSPASSDGAYPAAGLVALSGKLYGTTIGGGKYADGTTFEIVPSMGVEKVLHAFDCCGSSPDGEYPVAALVEHSGVLYGTTRNDGSGGAGTAFEARSTGRVTVLHVFAGKPDGATPQASLFWMDGSLYGTTTDGGTQSEGTVFRLTP